MSVIVVFLRPLGRRLRNGAMAKLQKVDIPSSNLKVSIVNVLKNEGYIKNYKLISDQKQGILRIYLKYINESDSVISEIKRISKPGGRRYVKNDNIPSIKQGLGIAILSTSKGLLTDKAARESEVGS